MVTVRDGTNVHEVVSVEPPSRGWHVRWLLCTQKKWTFMSSMSVSKQMSRIVRQKKVVCDGVTYAGSVPSTPV